MNKHKINLLVIMQAIVLAELFHDRPVLSGVAIVIMWFFTAELVVSLWVAILRLGIKRGNRAPDKEVPHAHH